MEGMIEKVRTRMDKQQFDVDDQLKTLGDLIDGVRGGKGGSAIVFGQRETGRSGVIEKAIEKHGEGVKVSHLWLSRLGTDSNALQTLVESEASKDPLVVVVDSADDLVCKSKQALLYRLLDRTKTQPWLVLLIITRQDMTSSLEKRVRSRLSNARVLMGEEMEEEKWMKVMMMILDPTNNEEKEKENVVVVAKKGKGRPKKGGITVENGSEETEEEKKWREFVHRFMEDPEAKRSIQVLYEWSGRLTTLKQTVNLWLALLEKEDIEMATDVALPDSDRLSSFRRAVDCWRNCVEHVVPLRESIGVAINNMPHRTFCVLAAVTRRLRANPAGLFPYAKIAVDFMHQCNHVDKRMLPEAELSTFKELDRLCEMGVLAIAAGSQSHSFRQIGLNCSLHSLLSHIRSGCHNSALKDWFESQPTN